MARPRKESEKEVVTVRILSDYMLDGIVMKSNSVHELPSEIADELVRNGIADSNHEAIEAARSWA